MDNPDKITFAIITSENLHRRLWIWLMDWLLLELFCETQMQFRSCQFTVLCSELWSMPSTGKSVAQMLREQDNSGFVCSQICS